MIDQFLFRNLCGRFATGITVVTAFDEQGMPVGMTANSFASVSLEPPLVSLAIDHAASAWPVLGKAERWTVNILESHQESLARRFASDSERRFEGVGWQRGPNGELLLDAVLAHLHCVRWGSMVAGDHDIIVGEVVGGAAAEHGRPLLYYRGGYADPESP